MSHFFPLFLFYFIGIVKSISFYKNFKILKLKLYHFPLSPPSNPSHAPSGSPSNSWPHICIYM